MSLNRGTLTKTVMVLLISTLFISAASAASVSIEDATSAVGVNTTAQIRVHDVANLNQFGIKLSYDPSVVIALSAENNANFPDDFSGSSLHDFSHASEGYVLLGSNPSTATPESGADVLLTTVTLQAVGGDSCTLGLTVTTLKDSDSAAITVDSVSNGTFTVEAGEPTGTYVSIEDTTSAVGVNTTAQIRVHDVANLNQFGIKLSYDPSVVIALSAENNANFPDDFSGSSLHDFSHASEGYVLLGSNPSTATPESGADVLLTTVTLQAVGGDSCTLGLTVTTLKDSDSAAITVDSVSNGTFTVGAVTPALTTFTVIPASVAQGGTVEIDIAFSTAVDWVINVNNSTATVATWSGTSTNPNMKPWDTTTDTATGAYTVEVFMNGALADSKTVTVTEAGVTPTLASITISPASCALGMGSTQTFTAVCTDTSGNGMTCPTLTWTSTDTAVGTITSTGVFTASTEGETTITASADSVTSNDATVTVYPTGTVIVTLYEGWNLMAVPVHDTSADTAAELASKIAGCKEVVMWDAVTDAYDTYSDIEGDWTGTDFAITGGMGIFVNVEGATTVGFTGDAWS